MSIPDTSLSHPVSADVPSLPTATADISQEEISKFVTPKEFKIQEADPGLYGTLMTPMQ